MKKVTEKDLSLDKQEVSALGGSNGTKDATDICTNPTVQTTLDSHNPPCCDITDELTCGMTCELSKCIDCPKTTDCPESDDKTGCVISEGNVTGCITPIPESKDVQCE